MIRPLGTVDTSNLLLKEELNAAEGAVFKIKISDSKTYAKNEEGRDEWGNLVPVIQYPEAFLALEIRIYSYPLYLSGLEILGDEYLFHEEKIICVYTYAINR